MRANDDDHGRLLSRNCSSRAAPCAVGATTAVNTHRASEGALPDHADHVGADWGSNYSIETMLDMHERMHERMHEQLTTCENKLAEREAELKAAAQTEADDLKKAIDATKKTAANLSNMANTLAKTLLGWQKFDENLTFKMPSKAEIEKLSSIEV